MNVCHVPGCGKPARLYPAGLLCEEHQPANQRKENEMSGQMGSDE